MELQRIKNTCSMFELGRFQSYLLNKRYSKNDFIEFIELQVRSFNAHKKNYSILYNCVDDDNYKLAKKLGFKQISSYKGHNNNHVRVLIWKSERYSILNRLHIFFNL